MNFQNPDTRKRAAQIVGVVFMLIILFGAYLAARTQTREAGVTTDRSKTSTTLSPLQKALDNVTTSTTAAPSTDATPDPIQNPNGSVLNTAQLANNYPQNKSGLNENDFATITNLATKFNLATTTGASVSDFASYYADGRYSNSPWIVPTTYKVDYVYAETTNVKSLYKTRVWFHGTTSTTGELIPQAIATVYFSADSATSVNPVHPDEIYNRGIEPLDFELTFVSLD